MSASGLFITGADGLKPLSEAPFELEADLQQLVADHPALLAGDDDEAAGRRFALVRREQGIATGEGEGARFSLDHLFVDQDGVPTLVEVKRASDTRARREVVAQMLDYAANARFLEPAELRADFEREHPENPQLALEASLGPDVDPESLWANTASNLDQGNLRLVFLADRILPELKTLVEFLNEQLRTIEVIAIEVSTFEAGETQVLRARTIGQTQVARAVKTGPARKPGRVWNEGDWLSVLVDTATPDEVAAVRKILAWRDRHSPPLTTTFGTGNVTTGMQMGIKDSTAYVFPFKIYNQTSVEVDFQTMRMAPYPPFHDRVNRTELFDRLNAWLEHPLDPERPRPTFALQELVGEGRVEQFLEIYDWALERAVECEYGYGTHDDAKRLST